jgi:HEAT repeat protein
MRELTVKLLASPDPRLSSSAVHDLALADAASPILTAQDLPALEKILWSGSTPIGVRVALLSELERREILPGSPQWVRLLRETRGEDRIAVVRAAAAHPSDPVTQELIGLLANDDVLLVSAAAISLGVPGNEKAVAPLAKLLGSSQERVRMSVIRGLGRIGTPSAQAVLAKTAASHPDPATRRRAGAEVARRP